DIGQIAGMIALFVVITMFLVRRIVMITGRLEIRRLTCAIFMYVKAVAIRWQVFQINDEQGAVLQLVDLYGADGFTIGILHGYKQFIIGMGSLRQQTQRDKKCSGAHADEGQ